MPPAPPKLVNWADGFVLPLRWVAPQYKESDPPPSDSVVTFSRVPQGDALYAASKTLARCVGGRGLGQAHWGSCRGGSGGGGGPPAARWQQLSPPALTTLPHPTPHACVICSSDYADCIKAVFKVSNPALRRRFDDASEGVDDTTTYLLHGAPSVRPAGSSPPQQLHCLLQLRYRCNACCSTDGGSTCASSGFLPARCCRRRAAERPPHAAPPQVGIASITRDGFDASLTDPFATAGRGT